MDPDALVLVSLGGDHDVSFIKNEDLNFRQVKAAELCSPIQKFPRRSNQNVVSKLSAPRNLKKNA